MFFFLFFLENWEVTFCCPKVKQFLFFCCCCLYRGHRNSGGQSLSLPELGFFDTILHNWLYPPAEKCNAIVSSAEGVDILSEGSSGVQLCSGMRLCSP